MLKCPKQFEFRYVLETPAPVAGRTLLGRCYHHTVALAESKKVVFGEITTAEEIADSFSDKWEREMEEKLVYDELGEERLEATVVDFGEEDPGILKDSGIKLAQIYIKTILPTLDILSIEKRLECEVEQIKFVGYPDLILQPGNIVIDHKVRKKKMSEKDIDGDIQLPSYAMLLGKPVTGKFYQALDTKEKKIEVAEKVVEQGEIDWVREQLIPSVWKQIQSGIFPPSGVQSWVCSAENCPYYLDCRKPWF